MKCVLALLSILPMALAKDWCNYGWSAPSNPNSLLDSACKASGMHYYCCTEPGTLGENPNPKDFPISRGNCVFADRQGFSPCLDGGCT
ncbi:hypothetical protein N7499_003582 [Penicillium canescens]|uniref:Uncharacterized protein n=1 Tax=Penicillium canescens TaxID=5083 RepID=A0AAD6IAR1_PENCN|nr:uncharacterized protein N7446_012516 [Penicillium canescens]KAJ6020300.1 hypothetical protein N7522_000375 [Penicillium canescens]KAJ6038713.1 hypothetical protein N7460_007430 [Penicillium canescens]KAJ6045652.1 hypothetical protein N7446_012516 [Penicillium canescens]KAJ6059991.1 hypothetical protein N7444_002923 [Penicillium canescens]KAJ6066251.1 hypothetical protein N7444_000004 [Penicillium canescens]